MSAAFVLLCVAALFLLLAALPIPSVPVQLGWLGMFFWALSLLVGR